MFIFLGFISYSCILVPNHAGIRRCGVAVCPSTALQHGVHQADALEKEYVRGVCARLFAVCATAMHGEVKANREAR